MKNNHCHRVTTQLQLIIIIIIIIILLLLLLLLLLLNLEALLQASLSKLLKEWNSHCLIRDHFMLLKISTVTKYVNLWNLRL